MNKEYKKETEVEGYLTGDGDCALIAPIKSPIGSKRTWEEWKKIDWEDKIYFGDIIPEEIKDTRNEKYKFKFIVRAEKSGSDK